ncbi:MAG: hypothetical protein ACE5F1_10085 [Planctomycetota bacterium]
MRRPQAIVFLLLLFSASESLSAQRREVFPRRFASATKEGGFSYKLFHLSKDKKPPQRWQQVLFPVDAAAAGKVTGLAFRPTNKPSRTVAAPAFQVQLEVGMGHSPNPLRQPSWLLSRNRGKDFRIVVDRKTINFAAVPFQSKVPYPFFYRIPFDRPAHLSAGKVGLWELRVLKSTLTFQEHGKMLIDGYWFPFNSKDKRYELTDIGTPCAPNPGEFHLRSTQLAPGQAGLVVTIPMTSGFGLQSLGFIFAGASDTRWGALKLPFDLTPFGGTGCKIHASLDVLPPEMNQAALSVWSAIDLPKVPSLVGKHIYFQAVGLPVGINTLGIVTSNGVKARIGPPYDIGLTRVEAPFFLDNNLDFGRRDLVWTPGFELTVQ